jgi:hypothetical protein
MIDTTFSRQDKFGFYQAGDFRSYSRFEVAEEAVKNGHKLHWNFNDEIYSCLDWTLEPKESLGELYRQRAQQLREEYDYLVLWFSGGADSTNILNSFLDNNIKLDEVASYVNYEATGDRYNFLNAEIYHVAAPVVEAAKLKQPWLQHTVIDLAQLTMDYFSDKSAKFDWIYHVNSHINPNACARRDIKLKIPSWNKMFDDGKKVGFIYGIDKPRVDVDVSDGNYYFTFIDMLDNAVNAECQLSNRSWEFNELFYWTPDFPEIVIKQGHVIKNYLKSAPDMSSFCEGYHILKSEVRSRMPNGRRQYLTLSVFHSLIYPNWKPVLYQAKPSNLLITPRDTWFFNLPNSDPAKYAWQTGLKHRAKLTNDFAMKNPDSPNSEFKNMVSNPYYLGK